MNKSIRKSNKGYAIIIDSLIALIIILGVFTIFYTLSHSKVAKTSEIKFKKLHYVSEDVLDVLNKEGTLDAIGENWAVANGSNTSESWGLAVNLTKEYFDKLIPRHIGYELLLDEVPLYSSDENLSSGRVLKNESETKTHATRLLVGYGAGLPTRGHVARAFLTSIREKTTSAYVYFGGFVGQGNLTRIISLPTTLDHVQQAYIELAAGTSFNLYVNGYDYGEFTPSGELMSANIREYLASPNDHFTTGDNTIEIKFSSGDISSHFIGGGFIKVTYNTSEMETTTSKETETIYYFPGIDGMINLFSSFYVPGDVSSIEGYLKFKNNYKTYLTIGDTRIFNSSGSNVTQEIYLNDSNFSSLDYGEISLQTVPLRMGTEGVTYIANVTGNADVILITDLSGSMNWRLDSSGTGVTRSCTDPNLYSGNTKRISLAKCLDNEFIDIILNTSGNRVGLVGYSGIPAYIPTATSTIIKSSHDLSTDSISLKTQVNSYTANGGTGICGSIRKARQLLESQSNDSRQKFIIVMTDGLANVQCNPSDLEYLLGCIPYLCPTTSYCSGGGCLYYQCGDYVSDKASSDAVSDSCKAHDDANATVYSIGFGPVSTCPLSNQTLQQVATCGNGTYYSSSDANELQDIYRGIAEQIVNMSYNAQTATITGQMNKSLLYTDSYLKFTYSPRNLSVYGEITLTQNTDRFNDTANCTGEIFITEHATVIDAKITSFSAEHWTDYLRINSQMAYNLRDGHFGYNYLILGDPFIVQIPNPETTLTPGQINIGEIRTGNSPSEDMLCSSDNRAIFTIRLNGMVGYGNVFPEKYGCIWNIQFEDDSHLISRIPSNYTGSNECSYAPGNITYNSLDAIDDAIIRLLEKLDSNNNNKIDVKFDSDMIEFDFSRSGGVRSLWGPITLKLVLWM